VTAGGTREPIDSVRFIGNRSSGRMGFALADEAARRGAAVTVIAANVALPRNPVVAYDDVATAAELKAACEVRFADCDVLLMAAAVADYRPAEAAATKLKKEAAEELDLRLRRTDDALAALSTARRPGQTLVGFAAEHGEDAVALGRAKLEGKGLDLVVVNDISRADIGFDTAENEVTIVAAVSENPVPRASKAAVASAILDAVEQQRSAGEYNLMHGAPGASGRPGAARA
jgi:phosphopantothenoylcysteine decarboxylase/phosphopantothenate--cysteine ligase